MKYITELHCHSSEVSGCSHMTARELVNHYIENGYSTVVLTNHYGESFFKASDKPSCDRVKDYFAPYYDMKEYAKGKLNVLIGLELRPRYNDNDYLIFGVTEALLEKTHNLYDFHTKELYAFAKENGLLVIQAHPFRNNMKITDPQYLDGIEVFNGAHTHESRNQIALAWAKEFHLIPSSGSDKHNFDQDCCGGIYTDKEIVTNKDLIEVLQSRKYALRMTGIGAVRDGLSDKLDANF